MMLRALMLVLGFLVPATASAQSEDTSSAVPLGDGMRAYVEGRYDDALTHLYRAVALQPEPLAFKLIVRVHDFQGNCSARDNAVQMLRELFPGANAPPPQRCVTTGLVALRCAANEKTVRIDDSFDAPCGQEISLPVGPHRVEARLGLRVTVDVRAGETARADLLGSPDKWYLDSPPRVALPARWLEPGLRDDPDMPRAFKWKRRD